MGERQAGTRSGVCVVCGASSRQNQTNAKKKLIFFPYFLFPVFTKQFMLMMKQKAEEKKNIVKVMLTAEPL